MKYFSFFLFPALVCAGDFMTGQAARFIIGQPTFTAQTTGTPSAYQLGAVGGVAYANNTLFIVDGNRVQATPIQNRVLIYNNISGFVLPPASEIPQGVRCPVCAGTPDTKGADLVLGQPDFLSTGINDSGTSVVASGFRTPTAVASDGQVLVVADTDNNRVLLWRSIPTSMNQRPDLVLGQADFTTVKQPPPLDSKSFRGPQGVWIQGTRLYVADTQNHRVLVWNNIPTTNYQSADMVLGEPNFSTAPQQNPTASNTGGTSSTMLNPVSVTSDGTRLFVSDLGHNRVMMWNTIPTQNGQAADIILGQPDSTSGDENNVTKLCASSTDSSGNVTYPGRCAATLSFPRFALSDGTRLFIADGGNDRIVVFKTMPTQTGQVGDSFIGQPDEFTDQVTDSTDTFRPDSNIGRSSPDSIRTPLSLAWDGANLYASDPYDRRVLVFTPALVSVPVNGVVNAASRAVFSVGAIDIAGTINAGDVLTVTIQGKDYAYTVVKADTLASIITSFVNLINASPGDPNVFAIANPGFNEFVLNAKAAGNAGNLVTLAVTTSTNAQIALTASSSTLSGGQSAAEVAPGTLVSVTGTNLSDNTLSSQPNGKGQYPTTLGGVEVYFDGIRAPIFFVSPTQVNTQVPFEVQDASGVSSYVVTHHNDGTVTATNAVNVPVVLENPGLFAQDGQDPRPVIAFHTTSNATAVVDIDGTVTAGDIGTITINGTAYAYTIQTSDTLSSIRDAFISLINADANSRVTATAAGQFTRIILAAKVSGPDGNGITVTGTAAAATSSGTAQLAVTALQSATCCASVAGTPVNMDNPAVPGEIISVYATGIGLVLPDDASAAALTGMVYQGPVINFPSSPVDNAEAGGQTANVLNAGLVPGMIGVYEVQLQLSQNLPTNLQTQLFIAQSVFTSNITTIPVVAP